MLDQADNIEDLNNDIKNLDQKDIYKTLDTKIRGCIVFSKVHGKIAWEENCNYRKRKENSTDSKNLKQTSKYKSLGNKSNKSYEGLLWKNVKSLLKAFEKYPNEQMRYSHEVDDSISQRY